MEVIFGVAVILLCVGIIYQDIKVNRLHDKKVILEIAINRARYHLRDQECKGEGDLRMAFIILDSDEIMDAQDTPRVRPKYETTTEN